MEQKRQSQRKSAKIDFQDKHLLNNSGRLWRI